MGFIYVEDLSCFFIDNTIRTTSVKVIIEDGLEDELKFLNEEVDTIWEFVLSHKSFSCKALGECKCCNKFYDDKILDILAAQND